MKALKEKAESGQTLIEPLLAIAIFGLLLAPFLGAINNLAGSQIKYQHQTEAAQYAREGLEIAYNQAVNDWENLSDISSPPEGRFTREVTVSQAQRDNDWNINDSGSNSDPDTLKVVSKVTWEERGRPQEIELTTYLIDLGAL